MAMLWELVCYVNCARVTLMGRVKALKEMRRDGSGSDTDRQAREINNCLLKISPGAIDNVISVGETSNILLQLMEKY